LVWSDTPEGEQWIEICDKLDIVLKDVGIDPEERKLIWPDAIRLDLDQSSNNASATCLLKSKDTVY
jgi:hypothetical protein